MDFENERAEKAKEQGEHQASRLGEGDSVQHGESESERGSTNSKLLYPNDSSGRRGDKISQGKKQILMGRCR